MYDDTIEFLHLWFPFKDIGHPSHEIRFISDFAISCSFKHFYMVFDCRIVEFRLYVSPKKMFYHQM